jgi:hypothetical protein
MYKSTGKYNGILKIKTKTKRFFQTKKQFYETNISNFIMCIRNIIMFE